MIEVIPSAALICCIIACVEITESVDDIRDALRQIEKALEIAPPIGAAELPDEVRFFRVLSSLRDALCPQMGYLVESAESRAGELATLISDCIVSMIGHFPIPAFTIAKQIAGMGFERFCEKPVELLKEKPSEGQPERKTSTE